MSGSGRICALVLVLSFLLLSSVTSPLPAGATPFGATLQVNTADDTNDAGGNNGHIDSFLSLREALALANGGITRCFTTGEKNQASGANWVLVPSPGPGCSYTPPEQRWTLNLLNPNVGANYADHIQFDYGLTEIMVTGELPALGQNDEIDGNQGGGFKLGLNGSALLAGTPSGIVIALTTNSTHGYIRNLAIYNFRGSGIYGPDTRIDGMTFAGLVIHDNGQTGISLLGHFGTPPLNPRNLHIGGPTADDRNLIYSNGQDGIRLEGSTAVDMGSDFGNHIEGNYIGVLVGGTTVAGNTGSGIHLVNLRGNVIGGDTAAYRNLVAGSGQDGITLEGLGSAANRVINNYIGTGATGISSLGNAWCGVRLKSGAGNDLSPLLIGNHIGEAGKGNVISSNSSSGICLQDSNTTGNQIDGNIIGSDPSLTFSRGNAEGIYLLAGAHGNQVGTNAPNSIGFNTVGIDIADSGTSGNQISSNYIGNKPGVRLANGIGVRVRSGAANNTLVANYISGNTLQGVILTDANTTGNVLDTNFIGQDGSGATMGNGWTNVELANAAASNVITANVIIDSAAFGLFLGGAGTNGNKVYANWIGMRNNTTNAGNAWEGVWIEGGASNNEIGAAGLGNVISANKADGLEIAGAATGGNLVRYNWIGVNTTGSKRANTGSGVVLSGSGGNTIANNVIGGNGAQGIYLNAAVGNILSFNRIGTSSLDGAANLGNSGNGILLDAVSHNNLVANTTVAFNGGSGIAALPGTYGNVFSQLNSYANGGLGIDLLNPSGVGCTGGASGANQCLASPTITSASPRHLAGSAPADALIEIYLADPDPSGSGEGRTFIAATAANHVTGAWSYTSSAGLCATYGPHLWVTATAMNPTTQVSESSTSEFSRTIAIPCQLYLPVILR